MGFKDIVTKRRKPLVSKNRKGYNEVAYTRKGVDKVVPLGSGSGAERKISTVWVTTKNGQKWEIPVDPKTGKVPEEYLFGRFLDIYSGTRSTHPRNIILDLSKDADMIHEIPEDGFLISLRSSSSMEHCLPRDGLQESSLVSCLQTGCTCGSANLQWKLQSRSRMH